MSQEVLINAYVPKYKASGEVKFYQAIIFYALQKMVLFEKKEIKGISPENELFDFYEKFLLIYRREGDEVYLKIAVLFRKAAHKIYRVLLKKQMVSRNSKFLNLI